MGSLVGIWYRRMKPFIAVVFMQIGYAGMDVLAKAAITKGMSNYVFVAYHHAVATIAIAPFALFLDRGIRPKMNCSTFMKIVALSILEPIIDQNLYFLGMKYTTATFASALINILPAFAFVMAWILRMEHVNVRSLHSQAKILGTITTMAGAMIMTFARGPAVHPSRSKTATFHQQAAETDMHKFILGALFIIVGCLSWAVFLILQAITLRTYPAELSLAALICFLGTIEGSVVALIVERRNLGAFALHWDINLSLYLYGGIICSGLTYYIQGIVMNERGPVFVSAFNPLCMVAVAAMSSIFLAEKMYMGRVIGAFVIVVGLYIVLWGKSRDYEKKPSTVADEQESVPGKEAVDVELAAVQVEEATAAAKNEKETYSEQGN